jgi:hypothetical protein
MEVDKKMKNLAFIKIAACAALLFAALSPRAVRADSWDKKTNITFSDAVQVPGATLPAGTYVFKLLNSSSDRYVVQIFNERQDHVFATILAIPDYRLNPPEKTHISFYEAPAGQPEPIKAWFYPGDNFGREFVYSKAEADVIATAAHETVPTEASIGTVSTAQNTAVVPEEKPAVGAQVTAPEPSTEDSDSADSAPAPLVADSEPAPMVASDDTASEDQQPQPAQDAAAPSTAAPSTNDTSSMPSTGSELPLAGLIALSSIAGALSLRAVRRLS